MSKYDKQAQGWVNEECHVKKQYANLFDSVLKPLVCLIAFSGLLIALYGVVVEFMHYYLRQALVMAEQLKSDLSIFIPWCTFGIAWSYGMVSLFKWAIELGVI